MKQYEIWWIDLPNPVGSRPVLVLTRTSALGYLGRALVAEVTTTIRGIPQEVRLGLREGLRRTCVANLDAARSVPVARLRAKIGALSAWKQRDVKRAMGHVVAWAELTALE